MAIHPSNFITPETGLQDNQIVLPRLRHQSEALPTPPNSGTIELRHDFDKAVDSELATQDPLIAYDDGSECDAQLFHKPSSPSQIASDSTLPGTLTIREPYQPPRQRSYDPTCTPWEPKTSKSSSSTRVPLRDVVNSTVHQKALLSRIQYARRKNRRYEWDELRWGLKRPSENDCSLVTTFKEDFSIAADKYYTNLLRTCEAQGITRTDGAVKSLKRKQSEQATSRRRMSKTIFPKTGDTVQKMAGSPAPGRRARGSAPGQNNEFKPTQKKPPEKPAMSDDYTHYRDYAPLASDLEDPSEHAQYLVNSLKKSNKYPGGPKPMPNEEDVEHLLHTAELELAHALALTPNRFLLTKRQIFSGYVENFLEPAQYKKKAWNKTSAQQNANVDVGKTSWVWRFYKKCGAWKGSHFEKYVSHGLPEGLDAAKDDDDK